MESEIEKYLKNPEELFEILYPKIFKYFYFREKNHADDLTQDVMMKIFKNLEKFQYENDTKFWAWIFRICKNTWINKNRSKWKIFSFSSFFNSNKHDYENLEIQIEDTSEEEDEFYKNFDTEKVISEFENEIKNLKPPKDEILMMYFFDKLTAKEISEILKKGKSAVKMTIHRELLKIREKFRKKFL